MNELLKLLNTINYNAFMFVKRQEYKIKSYLYGKKITKKIHDFHKNNTEDRLFELLELNHEDADGRQELNRFLRENFKDKYPAFISVIDYNENCAYCFEMLYAKEELVGIFDNKEVMNFRNMENKVFSYVLEKRNLYGAEIFRMYAKNFKQNIMQ